MTRTPLSAPDAARRRYLFSQTAILVGFAAVMWAANTLLPRVTVPWQRWLFAAGPVALLVLWAWAFFRMIRADDEMMQVVHLRAVALGAGLVLLAASLWDVVVRLLGAPALPTFLLLPVFALVYVCAMSILTPRQ